MERHYGPGITVHRHAERVLPARRSPGDPELRSGLTEHLERWLGPMTGLLEDVTHDLVRLSIFWFAADGPRDRHILVTCGMSERPMSAPPEAAGCRWAELVLALPAEWPMPPIALEECRWSWPIAEAREIARMPHRYATWLWQNHTIGDDEVPGPLACETRLCAWILDEARSLPFGARVARIGEREVHLFSLVPLHAEELWYAFRFGTAVLAARLARAGVTDLIDPGRPSVVREGRPSRPS